MGGSFDVTTGMIDCNGQLVTAKLNQVFRNPGTRKYKQAQDSNTFGNIQNVEGNWKDLLIAYLYAGVDVGDEFPAWVTYLQTLGAGATGTQGPINIYLIAQARYNSLIGNVGMDTKTNGNGGPVHTMPGSAGAQPSLIDSPCPP
jgi:hypothetical protein